jgi:tubulin polyglutamylase TTLL9
MNPLLIGGRKFDMRIYSLVTKYNPLVIWLYRTGFARFTHARYTNKFNEVYNQYIHLTNVAVQKTCDEYNKSTGGKWDLRRLKIFLYSKYHRDIVESLFDRIHDIIIKSIKSVKGIIVNDRHCFELYGYDILINSNMQPILLEINANSSLTSNTKEDNDLKVNMLDDMLTIIDKEKVLTGEERQVGGFDLIFKEGDEEINKCFNSSNEYSIVKTKLGCFNNREFQLKRLAKRRYLKMKELKMIG